MSATPTTFIQRFADAVELLCKKRPNDEIVAAWVDRIDGDTRLQEFAIEHGPEWAQGIAVLDAAHVMASQPTEDVEHESAPTHLGAGHQIEGLQSCAAENGWLRDGGMVYRLTDERRPTNRDEIRVTMADGSRTPEACARRAGELFDRLQSTHSGLQPLPAHSAYAVIDSMGWALNDTEKDDMLRIIRAYERRRGILTPGEVAGKAEGV